MVEYGHAFLSLCGFKLMPYKAVILLDSIFQLATSESLEKIPRLSVFLTGKLVSRQKLSYLSRQRTSRVGLVN